MAVLALDVGWLRWYGAPILWVMAGLLAGYVARGSRRAVLVGTFGGAFAAWTALFLLTVFVVNATTKRASSEDFGPSFRAAALCIYGSPLAVLLGALGGAIGTTMTRR